MEAMRPAASEKFENWAVDACTLMREPYGDYPVVALFDNAGVDAVDVSN